jgi:hypothetical protein
MPRPRPWPPLPRTARVARAARGLGAAALAALGAAPAAASISGVCPDGSIFVVQRAEAIPCSHAKQVEPNDLPPLKPGYLPRPYGWEQHQRSQDPNNPYNAVDGAPSLRRPEAEELRAPSPQPLAMRLEPGPSGAAATVGAAATPPPEPAQRAAAAPPAPGPAPGFSEAELRDLARIVELSQGRAPAAFRSDAAEGVALRLARSLAFEPRLRELLAAHGGLSAGPVVLFAARAERAARFQPHLTFVQGHLAFQPEAGNPRQMGLLSGRPGELAPGESVLGYAVLPPEIDLSRPLDVYWEDRLLTATLAPAR